MTLAVRTTKYVAAIADFVATQGHATNAQILRHMLTSYPDLSATTVHRVTARLVSRGLLAHAPAGTDNATVFDANNNPHDHFQCVACGCLRDIELPDEMITALQRSLGDCKLTGRLMIQGTCAHCETKENA